MSLLSGLVPWAKPATGTVLFNAQRKGKKQLCQYGFTPGTTQLQSIVSIQV